MSRKNCSKGRLAQVDRSEPDTWLSINRAVDQFGMSRRTFYRLLEAHPELVRTGVVVRMPPITGRWRVAARAFQEWMRAEGAKA